MAAQQISSKMIFQWFILVQVLLILTGLAMILYTYKAHPSRSMVPVETASVGSNKIERAISSVQTALPKCELKTSSKSVVLNTTIPTWMHLKSLSAGVRDGGHYKPADCRSKQRTAIIIPYRDRDEHLRVFLQHMHPFLQDQKLNYRIYVVELEKGVIFKKGLLMNAGFIESSRIAKTDCVVFHDVDMLPLNRLSSYNCDYKAVKHPSHYVKQFNYTAPYSSFLGGVLIFKESVFREVNGFSNLFWGWGGEDDDMRRRLENSSIEIKHPTSKSQRYWSWSHTRQVEFVNRGSLYLSSTKRMHRDGIHSAKKMYSVLKIEERPLYTWIYVSANQTSLPVKGIKPIYQPNKIKQ